MFDFMLAERLRMTVAAVQAMDNTEYLGWRAYYEVRPTLMKWAAHRAGY